jgi:uncharacterized phage-associated protein
MKLKYNEERTAQAAAFLLKLRGGRMSYMKLIKLLYLADRESLIRWKRSISFDTPLSLDNGPVLIQTLNICNTETPPTQYKPWNKYISFPQQFEVTLQEIPILDELSPKEVDLLKEIYERYGRFDRWTLNKITRSLPEWHDPHGSSSEISVEEILKSANINNVEIQETIEELDNLALMDDLIAAQ